MDLGAHPALRSKEDTSSATKISGYLEYPTYLSAVREPTSGLEPLPCSLRVNRSDAEVSDRFFSKLLPALASERQPRIAGRESAGPAVSYFGSCALMRPSPIGASF